MPPRDHDHRGRWNRGPQLFRPKPALTHDEEMTLPVEVPEGPNCHVCGLADKPGNRVRVFTASNGATSVAIRLCELTVLELERRMLPSADPMQLAETG